MVYYEEHYERSVLVMPVIKQEEKRISIFQQCYYSVVSMQMQPAPPYSTR